MQHALDSVAEGKLILSSFFRGLCDLLIDHDRLLRLWQGTLERGHEAEGCDSLAPIGSRICWQARHLRCPGQ